MSGEPTNPLELRPAEGGAGRYRDLLLLAVVVLGTGFRVAQYAARTSFWHDEALVVLNVAGKTCSQLMGRLDYAQAAPPLFLFAERGLLLALGRDEYALRLVSLLCGVAALPLFAIVCRRVLPGMVAPVTAAIFTFSNKLIWHSAEVKPYSGDAFVAVLLLYLALRPAGASRGAESADGETRDPAARLFILACVTAVAVWFSFPAAIIFGGLSLAYLPALAWRGKRGWVAYFTSNALVGVSFLLLYKYSIRPQHVEALSAYGPTISPTIPGPWASRCGFAARCIRSATTPTGRSGGSSSRWPRSARSAGAAEPAVPARGLPAPGRLGGRSGIPQAIPL